MKKILYLLTCWVPLTLVTKFTYLLLRLRAEYTRNPKPLLAELMRFDNRLYGLQGFLSIRDGDGVHSKHRHMQYHDFFAMHLKDGQTVLEVGCGYGALAHGIVNRRDVTLDAIDIVEKNIQKAQKMFPHERIRFIFGDALTYDFGKHYDAIVMSNVLEHIADRVSFLKKLTAATAPKQYILRVPSFERDWRVPLKEELGVDSRLDPTHYTEYTLESFEAEMVEAGLVIQTLDCRWGEIWATAIPKA